MVFSSLSFLYMFLPLVFAAYYIIKNRTWRNSVLLAASLVFYAWGEPKFVVMMLLSALVAYVGGCLMAKFRAAGREKAEKRVYVATVVFLVAALFVFKYFNFTVDNICALLGISHNLARIVLPIGISFYTFQILSYVIDLHRGEIALQRNFADLLLYVCFFPQLIAGPIVRYQTIEEEIRGRRENLDEVTQGLKRFIVGLAKKVIIANNVALVATTIYEGEAGVYGSLMYWVAALAYTLQIYFDFSGYSDMAIGLGRMFGFHFLENFEYPYISRSITEFWRRWHISLSSWFRDYIYIPLGGNRVKTSRHIINILIVWTITGFWHGAEWNFVMWGLYYAALLLVEKYLLKDILEKLPGAVRWVYTMFFVMLGWVIFYFTDIHQLGEAIKVMFTVPTGSFEDIVAQDAGMLYYLLYIPLGLVCMLPIAKHLPKSEGIAMQLVSYGLHFALLIICIACIVSSSFNPFIYFRF